MSNKSERGEDRKSERNTTAFTFGLTDLLTSGLTVQVSDATEASQYYFCLVQNILYQRQKAKCFLKPVITNFTTANNYEMSSKISEGVEINVETYYQADYSNPVNSEFMFAYRITIQNHNSFTIKLLRRQWYIFDSNGEQREVEGEGVVGVQPVMIQGQQFQYVSGCNLKTEMGRMYGFYTMENQNTKTTFKVKIPAFEMIVPFKNN